MVLLIDVVHVPLDDQDAEQQENDEFKGIEDDVADEVLENEEDNDDDEITSTPLVADATTIIPDING